MGVSGRPWAEALLAAAVAVGEAGPVGEALGRAGAALRGDPLIRAFFEDPATGRVPKAETLAAFYVSASVPGRALFTRFAALVAEKGRIGLVPAIAAAYRSSLDRREGLLRLELRSVRPLDPETVRRLAGAVLASEGGKRTEIVERRDPALIGGFVLRAGSVRWDRSLASKLARLGRSMVRPMAGAAAARAMPGTATNGGQGPAGNS